MIWLFLFLFAIALVFGVRAMGGLVLVGFAVLALVAVGVLVEDSQPKARIVSIQEPCVFLPDAKLSEWQVDILETGDIVLMEAPDLPAALECDAAQTRERHEQIAWWDLTAPDYPSEEEHSAAWERWKRERYGADIKVRTRIVPGTGPLSEHARAERDAAWERGYNEALDRMFAEWWETKRPAYEYALAKMRVENAARQEGVLPEAK